MDSETKIKAKIKPTGTGMLRDWSLHGEFKSHAESESRRLMLYLRDSKRKELK